MLKSFVVAIRGIGVAVKEQRNMKIHLLAVVAVVVLGVYVGISALEWAIVVLCFALVISAELINTALEEIVNFISPEYHPAAGKIKDIAAGAVLVAAVGAIFVAFFIFVKYFISI